MTGKATLVLSMAIHVLLYDLADGAWLAVRPSGTEPKLKIYMGVRGASEGDSEAQIKMLEGEADQLAGVE